MLFDEQYRQLSEADLKFAAERIFIGLSITDEQCKQIEKATYLQSKSDEWTRQRNGRLTASNFHDVFVRKVTTNPVTIVWRVMDYEHNLNFLPAIKWGNEHENVARWQYISEIPQIHMDFTCIVPGLIINSNYPHLCWS